MTKRPKIKVNTTKTDIAIELLGGFVIVAIWVFTLFNYSKLPEQIPVHYNVIGEVDSFGGKEHILTLPLVATILFTGLTILNKYPHTFNYPTTITSENAYFQYKKATQLIRFLKLVLAIIFGLIAFETIQNTENDTKNLGIWTLPTTLALLFLPIFYYLIKATKNEKEDKED